MLPSVADVRPDERRSVAAAFLTLFGVLAAHTLLETARDALFLARLPASQLPWVYLAMAALAAVLIQGPWASWRPLTGSHGLSVLLLASGVATFGFWALGSSTGPWSVRALYVWSGVVMTLAGVQIWVVLGEIYTITQAKRLYKLISLGSLLGAVAGGALGRLISGHSPAPNLVLASAILLALTGLGPALLLRRPDSRHTTAAGRPRPGLGESARLVWGHPYLTRRAGLLLVSTLALTLVDYLFRSAVAQNLPAARLATFFATFYTVLNGLAAAVQILLMGWLLRILGLHRTLWTVPLLLAFGAAGVALGGGFVAAIILKGTDGALREVNRTGMELLSVPVPDALRSRVKPLIELLGRRGGQALAALLILAAVHLPGADLMLATVVLALCVAWIGWAAALRPHYLGLFRTALREGSIRDRADLPPLDLESLELLFSALNSGDDAEVRGAMDLLVAEGRQRLIPALILYHPSPPVVLRALEIFETSGRDDFVVVVDRLLEHADDEIRAAALRARTAVQADLPLLRRATADPSPLVRATALVGLVSGGSVSEEASRALDELVKTGSVEARVALVRAIERRPARVFEDILLRLADSAEAEVQVHVARAMAALRADRFLAKLLSLLRNRESRNAARAALLNYGPAALRLLDQALAEPGLSHEIRRHLPRTMCRFPATEAAPVLLKHLVSERDGIVRYKILRGLCRMVADHPGVLLDPSVLREATERTMETVHRLLRWRVALKQGALADPHRATAGHELLITMLADKEAHALERLFRLLYLQFPGEDFRRIYRGLRSDDPKIRASGRELLEGLIRPPARDRILLLVEDAQEEERLTRARAHFGEGAMEYEAVLAELLEQPGETVRCIAAYHSYELGLKSLCDRPGVLTPGEGGLFRALVPHGVLNPISFPRPEGKVYAR